MSQKKIGKIGKGQASMIMSLMAIAVLVIPAGAFWYIEDSGTARVLEYEGLYTNGTALSFVEPVNQTFAEYSAGLDVRTLDGEEAGNETVFIGENSSGVYEDRVHGYYADFISYAGNGTYTITPNWSYMPDANFSAGRYFVIELNMTGQELTDYDWLKLHYSGDGSPYLGYYGGVFSKWQWTAVSSDEYIIAIGLAFESQLLSYHPDNNIYLVLGADGVEQWDEEPATISYKVEAFSYEPADAPIIDDNTLYVGTLVGVDFLLIVSILFTTNFIDIRLDRRRK